MKLPDVNLLVAAAWPAHVHHAQASGWLAANPRFATCDLTELGLVRVLLVHGAGPEVAFGQLASLTAAHRARLVPADLGGEAAAGVTGHRQVTDFYLARLAAAHRLKLATFDRPLAARFPEHCELVS